MLKILSFLLLSLITVSAFAQPSVRFQYMRNSSGGYQLGVKGSDLCESAKFKIRVTDLNSGDTDWYRSHSGNTEWKVTNCKIGPMMLQAEVMKPGHILQVRTYSYQGNKTHTFQKTIPCDNNQWENEFNDSEVFENGFAEVRTCSGQTQPPPPPPLNCRSRANISSYSQMAELSVSCNYETAVIASIYERSTGRLLCVNNRFVANVVEYPACTFPRDRTQKLEYISKVFEFRTGMLLSTDIGVIYKDPTYNYNPEGKLLSESSMNPQAQKKALGRGLFWEVPVKVSAADFDVDPSEGQRLIKIEAIVTNSKGTKTVIKTSANSGESVVLKMEHEYIKPLMFGSPHESDEGFVRGENTIVIRVYDAYEGKTYVDLSPVKVFIKE